MKNQLNRGRENKIYIGILVIVSVLFGVFFTSKTWLYDDSAIAQTPYNESIGGLNQTTVILRDWQYNPENELMEVTLETVHTGTDAGEPTFTFEAKGKDSNATYPVKKVYESDNMMVIQIEHVPATYRVIGLFVTEHRDEKILKQEYKRQLMNDGDVATAANDEIKPSDLPEPEEIIIVGDYRKIDVNKELVTKTDKEYQKEKILAEMKRIKDQISVLIEESIPFQKELIETLQQEKEELKQEMAFQTEEEQVETKKEVEHKGNAIQNAKEEIDKLQEKLKELQEKYQNREEKLDALTQTDEEKQQQETENKEPSTQKNNKKDDRQDQQKKENESKHESEKAKKNSSKENKKSSKKDKDTAKKEQKKGKKPPKKPENKRLEPI